MEILMKYCSQRFAACAWLVCAALLLSLAPKSAHAGKWLTKSKIDVISIDSNGYMLAWPDPNNDPDQDYYWTNTDETEYDSFPAAFRYTYGSVTKTLYWSPDVPNEPVPAKVLVEEHIQSRVSIYQGIAQDSAFLNLSNGFDGDPTTYASNWASCDGTHRRLIRTNGRSEITLPPINLRAAVSVDPKRVMADEFLFDVHDAGEPKWNSFNITKSQIGLRFFSQEPVNIYRAKDGESFEKIASSVPIDTNITNGNMPGYYFGSYDDVGLKAHTEYKYYATNVYPDGTEGSDGNIQALTTGPGVQITKSELPDGFLADAYSQTIQSTGGNANNVWTTQGNLPPGLTFTGTGATATITGTPTDDPATPGIYPFQVTVDDGVNGTDTESFTLKVDDKLHITTTSLPDGVVGQPYSQEIAAAGGDAKYTWLINGSDTDLPPGLQIDETGFSVVGTPSAQGVFTVTATVDDQSHHEDSKTYTITIASPSQVSITTTELPSGDVGVPYATQLQATGGFAPYSWWVSGGICPEGLQVNPDGSLKGMPTQEADEPFTFDVSVMDETGQIATQTFGTPIVFPGDTPPDDSQVSYFPDSFVGVYYEPDTSQPSVRFRPSLVGAIRPHIGSSQVFQASCTTRVPWTVIPDLWDHLKPGGGGLVPVSGMGPVAWFKHWGDPTIGFNPLDAPGREGRTVVEAEVSLPDGHTVMVSGPDTFKNQYKNRPGILYIDMDAKWLEMQDQLHLWVVAENDNKEPPAKKLPGKMKARFFRYLADMVGVGDSNLCPTKVMEVYMHDSIFSQANHVFKPGSIILCGDAQYMRIKGGFMGLFKALNRDKFIFKPSPDFEAAAIKWIKENHPGRTYNPKEWLIFKYSASAQKILHVAGGLGCIVGIAGSAYEIYTAKNKLKAVIQAGAGMVGAEVGAGLMQSLIMPYTISGGPVAWGISACADLIGGGVGYYIFKGTCGLLFELVVHPHSSFKSITQDFNEF